MRGLCCSPQRQKAFTLLELLVVVGVVCLLGSLLAPGHAGTRKTAQGFQCFANVRQLMMANLMYQRDNNGALPMSFHGGFIPSLRGIDRPWATGWLDWSVGTDNTNVNYLLQPRYGSIGVYVGSAKFYKCPADTYVSPAQSARGWTGRVRSYSANLYVGKGNAWSTSLGYTASGPNNLTVYKGTEKESDLTIPGPARTYVYIDEHPDSINDPGFWPPNTALRFPDAPATSHNRAAGVAFADGHAEMHSWVGPTLTKPRSRGGLAGVSGTAQNLYSTSAGDPDVHWLSYGSPRHTKLRTVGN